MGLVDARSGMGGVPRATVMAKVLKISWMRGLSAGFTTGQMAFPEYLLTNGCQAGGALAHVTHSSQWQEALLPPLRQKEDLRHSKAVTPAQHHRAST